MSKYNEMMGNMHMPEEQREQLREELMRRAEVKEDKSLETRRYRRPVWRRYAVAAALALCLFGTAATAYAAVRYQWFMLFFDNAGQETDILRQYSEKASTEEVTAQNEHYKFTVLNHLYSQDQQMGLIFLSFSFLTENYKYLAVNDRQNQRGVILEKDGIITGEDEVNEVFEDTSKLQMSLMVGDGTYTGVSSGMVSYFSGELAKDGGYLIGLRYSFTAHDGYVPEDLILSLENAGDVEHKMRVVLPKSEEVESVRLVSEDKPEDSIVISPMGMVITTTADKEKYLRSAYDYFKDMKLVMKDSTKTIKEIGAGYGMSCLESETESTCTWRGETEFINLIDISELKYIERNGVKYHR